MRRLVMYHATTKDHRDHRVPRFALAGAAARIVVTLAATAAARVAGVSRVGFETGLAAESRLLHFEDRSDGAIVVVDDADGTSSLVPAGTNGFLRGVLRGVARERRQH